MPDVCAWCEECMARNGVRPGDHCGHHNATVADEVIRGVPVFGGRLSFLCDHKHQAAPPRQRRLRRRKRTRV